MSAGKPAAGSIDLPYDDCCPATHDPSLGAAACLLSGCPIHTQQPEASLRCFAPDSCRPAAVGAASDLAALHPAPAEAKLLLLLLGGSTACSRAPSNRTCPWPTTQEQQLGCW